MPVSFERRDYQYVRVEQVPSRFIPYGKDPGIFIRGYTYGEVKRLSHESLTEEEIVEVFRGIVQFRDDPEFDLAFLSLEDFAYITLLVLFSSRPSYGWTLRFRCPFCGEEGETRLGRSDIKFNEMKAEKLPVRVSLYSGRELALYPLTVADRLRLGGLRKDDTDENLLSVALMAHDEDPLALYSWMEQNLEERDLDLIEKALSYLDHGIMPLDATCPKGHKLKVPVDPDLVDFVPFRSDEDAGEDRIRFG